jgi:hypothetical protein
MNDAQQRQPWRDVMSSRLTTGRGSLLGPDTSRRAKWYVLDLECGHRVERSARFRPLPNPSRGGTQHRSRSDALPPPRKVRCEVCAPVRRSPVIR